MSLDEDMLDKSMSSDAEGALSPSMSSEGSSRYGSEEEFNVDDAFQEFIDEPKYPSKKKESEEECKEVDEGEEEESEQEEEDEENEEDNFDYDSNDEDQYFLFLIITYFVFFFRAFNAHFCKVSF